MSPQPARDPFLTALVAWQVPGGGHFLLGQRWRGIALFAMIVTTFVVGLALTDGAAVELEEIRRLSVSGLLVGVAQVFAGLPFAAGAGLDALRAPPALTPDLVARLDLGRLYTMVAGLLNLLLVIDAYERAGKAARP